MTEELIAWVKQVNGGLQNVDGEVNYEHEAHFWLRAFVREVERRAKIDSDPFGHGFKTELRILGVALEEVVRDFGLDQEER